MATTPVLKVAVNVPLSRLFDYLPPAVGDCPVPGSRVRVPFGRRNEVGLVLEYHRVARARARPLAHQLHLPHLHLLLEAAVLLSELLEKGEGGQQADVQQSHGEEEVL